MFFMYHRTTAITALAVALFLASPARAMDEFEDMIKSVENFNTKLVEENTSNGQQRDNGFTNEQQSANLNLNQLSFGTSIFQQQSKNPARSGINKENTFEGQQPIFNMYRLFTGDNIFQQQSKKPESSRVKKRKKSPA